MQVFRLVAGIREATLLVDTGSPLLARFGSTFTGSPAVSLFERSVPPAGLDEPARPCLITDPSAGWCGPPGIVLTRDGVAITPQLLLQHVDASDTDASFRLTDERTGIEVGVQVRLHESGVLALTASVTNLGALPLGVDTLALTVPVPDHLGELLRLGGRHAMEFCEERSPWGRTVHSISSRQGRTSHQQNPSVVCLERSTDERNGDAWAFHLAWSGNFQIFCDGVTADRRTIVAGELLAPGDVVLEQGATYRTPTLLVSMGTGGLSDVTASLHRHLRSISPRRGQPRPVIVNTWEAVYFDHETDKLFELARRAAFVGAERFVLDDGWFLGRRDDTAGLGDWEVDPVVWPNGLEPLIRHVTSLGMDFGLWVEPEMVNPNSNLYRTHPDWVLGAPHQHALTGRNQLVLDFSRADVCDHIHSTISRLLHAHQIAHLKWDHNRVLVSTHSHHHTAGVLDVMARLRSDHPDVDFESCASGGGRMDAAIARHATRFWTSDSIDALDRLSIQRGALRIFPPEMLGAHIGSEVCHTTGRHHRLPFRALSAFPFWLGIEWNLNDASEKELQRLADVIAVHKRFRHLLHAGTTRFTDHHDSPIHQHAIVSDDRTEALVVIAAMASGARHSYGSARIDGLDASARYRCSLVDLGTHRFALNRGLPSWLSHGVDATGGELAEIGLPLPPLLPASGILVHVERM